MRQQLTDPIDGANDVRARLSRNHQQYSRLPVREACILGVFNGVANVSNFVQEYRRSTLGGYDQILIVDGFKDLVVSTDAPRALDAADLSLGGMRIR